MSVYDGIFVYFHFPVDVKGYILHTLPHRVLGAVAEMIQLVFLFLNKT